MYVFFNRAVSLCTFFAFFVQVSLGGSFIQGNGMLMFLFCNAITNCLTQLLQRRKIKTLALHVWETGQNIHFQDTEVLNRSPVWGTRVIMESLEISIRSDVINKEDGAELSKVWFPAYDLLKLGGRTIPAVSSACSQLVRQRTAASYTIKIGVCRKIA